MNAFCTSTISGMHY